MKRSRSEQQCGRTRCAPRLEGSRRRRRRMIELNVRALRERFWLPCVGGECELRRGCLPPRTSLTLCGNSERGWYLSARGPQRILCLKRDAELISSSALAASQTRRGQDSMEKKKGKKKIKNTQRFVVNSIGNFLCGFWAPLPVTTKRPLQLPLALPPSLVLFLAEGRAPF